MHKPGRNEPREYRFLVGSAQLYAREVGRGKPIIILHGGPALDHRYLLPEMDALGDSFRLVYYDQRGRGSSAEGVQSEEITFQSELNDLEQVRRRFRLASPVVLGHSFGSLLALEYALRFPDHVSKIILMNPAPASAADWSLLAKRHQSGLGSDAGRLESLEQTAAYKEGEPESELEVDRIWFRPGLARPEDLELLLTRLREGSTCASILRGRAIAERLFAQTLLAGSYDLASRLGSLAIPTLIIYGDHEFVPSVVVERIVRALPNARMITLRECGHFPTLEQPEALRDEIVAFLEPART